MRPFLPYLLLALCLAVLASLIASSAPDGLERVAVWLGFADHAVPKQVLKSPLPDYTVPGIGTRPLSTALAGSLGVIICFLLPFGLFLLRKK